MYVEINFEEILEVKARIDTTDHQARWDVMRLFVNPEHYGPFCLAIDPGIALEGILA